MNAKLIFLSVVLSVVGVSACGQNGPVRRVAVLDLMDSEGCFSNGIKLMIRSSLSAAVSNTPGYEGYDRVDITSIMDEHEFQRTGLVSDTQIKRLGEMTGADYILASEVARFDRDHVVMTAKILNVESAKLERTSDMTATMDIETLERCCRTFVEKLLAVNIVTGVQKGGLEVDGNMYVGEYRNGKPHGTGVMRFSGDDEAGRKSYKGEWRDGLCHGRGTMVYNNMEMYVGEFDAGIRSGKGMYHYPNGNRYEGGWRNDRQSGNGQLYYAADDPENRLYFEGFWENGVRTGLGKTLFRNDDKEEVSYRDDRRNGPAILRMLDGGRCEGLYFDDKKEGKWKCYDCSGKHTGTRTYKNGVLVKTMVHNKKQSR